MSNNHVMASLQRDRKYLILTPEVMFKFCNENIKGIGFFFLSKTDIASNHEFLQQRYKIGKTISGRRSCHEFIPLSTTSIALKIGSSDTEFTRIHNFTLDQQETSSYSVLEYVCCIYKGNWWIGLIMEVEKELSDFFVKFMHPHGPATTFHSPKDDYARYHQFISFVK